MALEIHALDIIDPPDLVNHPENLRRVSITHDGESTSYMRDETGWFTFGAYNTTLDNHCECLEVTPETVIAEIIRAIALSVEEPVELWLS